MNKKIVVIGSINNDLVIEVDSKPIMGQTVLGKNFIQVAGGKGANQAVACARLGADVTFIGAVGDDIAGTVMVENLKANGVCTDYIKTVKGKPTGTAMILICDGDNYIAVDQGANLHVCKEQITDDILKNADMVLMQLEIPLETVKYALEKCKSLGVRTLLNPAPASKDPLVYDIIKIADIITPNQNEICLLTKTQTVIMAVKELSDMGAGQIVLTMGGEGVIYSGFLHMPAVKVEHVVDTTAAGDSFSAALAVALTEGKAFEKAVRFATKVGALTVTKKGAIPSLPYRNEVEDN